MTRRSTATGGRHHRRLAPRPGAGGARGPARTPAWWSRPWPGRAWPHPSPSRARCSRSRP